MSGFGGLLGLLPILAAGFVFNVIFYRTRYASAGADGQRLFFMCAVPGFVLAAVAFPLYKQIGQQHFGQFVADVYPVPYVGELATTLILGPLLALLLNGLILIVRKASDDAVGNTWEWVFTRLTARLGNPLQQLLVRATESQQLVMVTLTSRKVYCGLIVRLPPSFDDSDLFVEIIPKFSATRDKDDLSLLARLDYISFDLWRTQRRIAILEKSLGKPPHSLRPDGTSSIPPQEKARLQEELSSLQELMREMERRAPPGYLSGFNIQEWAKVIPVAQIESACMFDENAPEQWFTTAGRPNHPPAALVESSS